MVTREAKMWRIIAIDEIKLKTNGSEVNVLVIRLETKEPSSIVCLLPIVELQHFIVPKR